MMIERCILCGKRAAQMKVMEKRDFGRAMLYPDVCIDCEEYLESEGYKASRLGDY